MSDCGVCDPSARTLFIPALGSQALVAGNWLERIGRLVSIPGGDSRSRLVRRIDGYRE
jgi:hypothetical protein